MHPVLRESAHNSVVYSTWGALSSYVSLTAGQPITCMSRHYHSQLQFMGRDYIYLALGVPDTNRALPSSPDCRHPRTAHSHPRTPISVCEHVNDSVRILTGSLSPCLQSAHHSSHSINSRKPLAERHFGGVVHYGDQETRTSWMTERNPVTQRHFRKTLARR